MGGMPTDSETMTPIRTPLSRLSHPVNRELGSEVGLELEVVPEPVSVPLPLLNDEGDEVRAGLVATGPTSMVVVAMGWPGAVWSQLSIMAAMPPV